MNKNPFDTLLNKHDAINAMSAQISASEGTVFLSNVESLIHDYKLDMQKGVCYGELSVQIAVMDSLNITDHFRRQVRLAAVLLEQLIKLRLREDGEMVLAEFSKEMTENVNAALSEQGDPEVKNWYAHLINTLGLSECASFFNLYLLCDLDTAVHMEELKDQDKDSIQILTDKVTIVDILYLVTSYMGDASEILRGMLDVRKLKMGTVDPYEEWQRHR